MIRLPRPRTPLPLYLTRPSAAAVIGSPSAPEMSMPLLLALKVCTIAPLAGHAQLMTLASAARGEGLTSTGAGAGVADESGGGSDATGASG
ncbi:hypothetical protein G6F24_018067 [Rhizopus arrhizus]|nr:hypothetical protein G6F24_018067 [Rhizopus arrhizus]